jgi:hypothetical protein
MAVFDECSASVGEQEVLVHAVKYRLAAHLGDYVAKRRLPLSRTGFCLRVIARALRLPAELRQQLRQCWPRDCSLCFPPLHRNKTQHDQAPPRGYNRASLFRCRCSGNKFTTAQMRLKCGSEGYKTIDGYSVQKTRGTRHVWPNPH